MSKTVGQETPPTVHNTHQFPSLPPLPPILSTQIREQVFTHRSYYARPTHIFEDHPEDLSPDNEKFEYLGDTVLGLVVTKLMLEMYPGLRVGPSTKIRAMVVGNSTLADISTRYRLTDRLRLHPAQEIALKASINVQADVFESYVGGLYTDQGLDTVQAWLRPLFTPFVMSAYHIVRAHHGLPPTEESVSGVGVFEKEEPDSETQEAEVVGADLDLAARVEGSLNFRNEKPSTKPPLRGDSTAADNKNPIKLLNGQTQPRPHPNPNNFNVSYSRSTPLPPPHHISTSTTVGHLALFNQNLQKENREVEWVYRVMEGYPATRAPSLKTTPSLTTKAGTAGPGTALSPMMLALLPKSKTTPIWGVRVIVDGEEFGEGKGNTKKAARNEAAKMGLEKMGFKF